MTGKDLLQPGICLSRCPKATGEVENMARERFYEISVKSCMVEWPGREGRALFADNHCVSHIVARSFYIPQSNIN